MSVNCKVKALLRPIGLIVVNFLGSLRPRSTERVESHPRIYLLMATNAVVKLGRRRRRRPSFTTALVQRSCWGPRVWKLEMTGSASVGRYAARVRRRGRARNGRRIMRCDDRRRGQGRARWQVDLGGEAARFGPRRPRSVSYGRRARHRRLANARRTDAVVARHQRARWATVHSLVSTAFVTFQHRVLTIDILQEIGFNCLNNSIISSCMHMRSDCVKFIYFQRR